MEYKHSSLLTIDFKHFILRIQMSRFSFDSQLGCNNSLKKITSCSAVDVAIWDQYEL